METTFELGPVYQGENNSRKLIVNYELIPGCEYRLIFRLADGSEYITGLSGNEYMIPSTITTFSERVTVQWVAVRGGEYIKKSDLFSFWPGRSLGKAKTPIPEDVEDTISRMEAIEERAEQAATNSEAAANRAEAAAEATQEQVDIVDRLAIKQTATGSTIHVSDAADWQLQDLKMYGETTQKTTTGKNLYPRLFEGQSTTRSGLTYEYQKDGGLRIYGTSTVQYNNVTLLNILLKAGTYYVSGGVAGGTGRARISFGSNVYWNQSFTLTEDTLINFQVQVDDNMNALDNVIYPQLELGTAKTDFEPYTGGAPSPSPDYPQELASKEISEIRVCGKNLLNYASKGYTGTDGTYGEYAVYCSSIIDVRNIDTIYLSGNFALLNSGTVRMGLYNEYPNAGAIGVRQSGGANMVINTVNYNYVLISLLPVDYANPDNLIPVKESFQCEIGAAKTAFEPYKEQTVTLSQPITLRGIGDIKDRLECIDGVYGITRNFREIVFDGGANTPVCMDDYVIHASSSMFRRGYNNILKKGGSIKCDKLNARQIWSEEVEGCRQIEESVDIRLTHERLGITSTDNIADKETKLKAYLISNPITVIAQLKTPTFEPLPEADQTAIKALKTYLGQTNIYNDANAYMEILYATDTKSYVDNKIAELTALILEG